MTSSAVANDTTPFGALLREWREHRRMSQLALAVEADISQRHISFLESGRANPSRVAVARLAEALAIPLRERNVLLRSAGFADRYPDHQLSEEDDPVFRQALAAVLENHQPYPAVVLDGRWNMVMANDAALRFFARFIDLEAALGALGADDFQVARLCLHEAGFKPFIRNWAEVVESILRRARLALLDNPRDAALAAFIDEVRRHPDAPASWQAPERSLQPEPVLTLQLQRGDESYRLFTLLAHFGNPRSVTLQELSVEAFLPADDATRARLHALADKEQSVVGGTGSGARR